MNVFTCSRLVDQATVENDLPAPGAVLAEAVQLARKDSNNVNRLVTNAMKRLEKPSVIIRLKTLRFLLHLTQNGPPSVQNELKLYSAQISACMSWRGLPHPTRGYEPYQEMKDVAQSLLDLVFTVSSTQPVAASSYAGNTGGAGFLTGAQRVAGISNMESCGSGPQFTQAASLEPRNLNPKKGVDEEILGFFKKTFKIEDKKPVQSKYGSASNVSGYQQGYASAGPTNYGVSASFQYQQQQPQYQYQQPQGDFSQPMYGAQPTYQPQQPMYQQQTYQPEPQPIPPPMPAYAPAPQRGQFDAIQKDVSWANKKSIDAPVRKVETKSTPAAKLLKVTGNRALPTNGELTAFRNAISPESVEELTAAVTSSDWKVRVRAIAGLEIAGETYGLGAVAGVKAEVEKNTRAPQASLKSFANRFYEKIKDVEPTGLPEEPSAFDFGSAEAEEAPAGDDEVIDFGAAEDAEAAPAEEKPAEEEKPAQEEEEADGAEQ